MASGNAVTKEDALGPAVARTGKSGARAAISTAAIILGRLDPVCYVAILVVVATVGHSWPERNNSTGEQTGQRGGEGILQVGGQRSRHEGVQERQRRAGGLMFSCVSAAKNLACPEPLPAAPPCPPLPHAYPCPTMGNTNQITARQMTVRIRGPVVLESRTCESSCCCWAPSSCNAHVLKAETTSRI